MSGQAGPPRTRFEPLRPATRGRLIAAFILGPIAWLAVLTIAAVVLEYTGAIALGLAVTVASFVIALVVLALIHAARLRQEERYAERR